LYNKIYVKILAIDYGTRTVGLAAADTAVPIPLPRAALAVRNDRDAVEQVLRVLREEPYGLVLVGLPAARDPERSWIVRKARAFADRLREASGLPVEMVDETGTSHEASSRLRPGAPEDAVDSGAAALLLETWLARC
jgi:putative Holliday junction resolvase